MPLALVERLRAWLGTPPPEDEAAALRLAAATLLVEVAAADLQHDPRERAAVLAALLRRFELDAAAAEALLERAEREQDAAVSLYDYTRVLNEALAPEARFAMLVELWRVAWSDGEVDPYEEQRLRRIAELLHLSDRDFVRAKWRAAED